MLLINTASSFAEVQAEEAIIIAKDYMKDNGLDNDYVLFWPSVTENSSDKDSWHVSFPPTVTAFLAGQLSFGVDIDKKTGEATSVSQDK